MTQKNLALEEYIAFLKEYRYGKNPFLFQNCQISFVKAAGEVTKIVIDDTKPYGISGNNCDGFILTETVGKEEKNEI